MIRQDDPSMPLAIRTWGCYFMACLYHCGLKRGREFEPEEILAVYKSAMLTGIVSKEIFKDGVLTDGCTVLDPVALFNLCGVRVSSISRPGPDYVCAPEEYEIQCWHRDADTPKGMGNKEHTHFVAAVNGELVYDGLGQSNTVKYGKMVSKRVLK